ncbi:MAG: glycosyltransferase family 2 protein [bacterium]
MRTNTETQCTISVIVPTYNGERYLPGCLKSLLDQTFRDAEIIVVDNGSTDGSIPLIKKNFSQIVAVELGENLGFSGAVNEGIRRSEGGLIALLNNDAEAEPHWLENLHRASVEHSEASWFASKILCFDSRDVLDNAGHNFRPLGGVDRGFRRRDTPKYNKPGYIFGACAGAALYRREMLERLGGFDEDFFFYIEDFDLNFRAQLAGYKCWYVPDAVVYHRGAGTAGLYSNFHAYYQSRNTLLTLIKDLPTEGWLKLSLPILKAQMGNASYFASRGQGRAISMSKLSVLPLLPKMLRKRWRVQMGRKASWDYLLSLEDV